MKRNWVILAVAYGTVGLLFCGPLAVGVSPSLRAEKNVGLAVDADGDGRASPGDVLAYSIRIQNAGEVSATEVVLTDPLPFATTLVPGSIFIDQGELLDDDPIVVAVGEIFGGLDSASVGFRVEIADPLPLGVREIANQGTVSSLELPEIVTDDPSTPAPLDATVVTLGAPFPVEVPALGDAATCLLAGLLAGLGVAALRLRG